MRHTPFCRALASLLVVALAGQIPAVAAEPQTLSDDLYVSPPEFYESQPEFYVSQPEYYESQPDVIPPSWTGRVGYVHMWREQGSDVLIVEPDVGLIPRFTSSEFDFDGSSGIDAAISRVNGCGWGFDFRYLWVNDYNATERFFPLDDPQIATNPPTGTLFDTGDLFLLDYTSEIQSFEALVRHNLGRFGVSAGFRYIQLNESLGINIFENPGGIFADEFGFAAANDLYGFQLGLDGPLWDRGGKFRVDGFAKFGVYGNSIRASAFFDDPGTPLLSGSGTGDSNHTACALETGLFATYDITRNLSLRGGYQLLYIDGVALAADQVPNTGNLVGLPGSVDVTADGGNSVLYHGLNVGLECRF